MLKIRVGYLKSDEKLALFQECSSPSETGSSVLVLIPLSASKCK